MANSQSPYPNGCLSAVSLTFDDASNSQYHVALPILNERNLKATFYIATVDAAPGYDTWQDFLQRWREVQHQGHEIGNHTRSHICSRAFRNDPEARCLETLTLDDICNDVLEAERRLNEVFGPSERTFAYPCYQDYVGEGVNRQTYVPFIAENFVAARNRGEYANYPLTCSLSYLWSYPVEHMSGDAMIRLIERAVEQEQWCILAFHGIDVGTLQVAKDDFVQVCDYLASNRESIWTAPVIEVARRILEWRAALQ